ncbi:acetate--CoA ligase family protein [archaeon]|nr:acetate--CoA ligase family protein [archaeon]
MISKLGFNDTKDILKKYGVPVPDGGIAKTEHEAVETAKQIGFPIILKSSQKEATDASVLASPDEVRQEYLRISQGAADGQEIIVQKHAEHGMEAIIGMTRDPELGPIMTFGLSGVFAFIKDVSSRIGPVSHDEAIKMIKETEAYAIIKGDIGSIADVIAKVSTLAMENENIKGLEINPLFIYESDVLAVDILIMAE